MIPVNSIAYANTSVNPHIFTPNLPLMASVSNSTNNTNITLQTPCAICQLEGQYDGAVTTNNAVDNSKSISSNVETNVLSILNKATVNSKANNTPVGLLILSVYADGSQPVTVRLKRNVSFTSTPSWTDVNATNSVVAYNTTGVYSAGTGKLVTSLQLQKTDASLENVYDLGVQLSPGETWTVTAVSSSTSTVGASLTWREYF
jgi:hypothetical protein